MLPGGRTKAEPPAKPGKPKCRSAGGQRRSLAVRPVRPGFLCGSKDRKEELRLRRAAGQYADLSGPQPETPLLRLLPGLRRPASPAPGLLRRAALKKQRQLPSEKGAVFFCVLRKGPVQSVCVFSNAVSAAARRAFETPFRDGEASEGLYPVSAARHWAPLLSCPPPPGTGQSRAGLPDGQKLTGPLGKAERVSPGRPPGAFCACSF